MIALPLPPNRVLAQALAYLESGLVPIPIRLDGSKAPAIASWRRWQAEVPSEAQVRSWFAQEAGIGLILGCVSGGAECIDFDSPDLLRPVLLGLSVADRHRLAIYSTPGGYHMVYRCQEVSPSAKIARAADGKTLIESRGEGAYIVAAGSPLSVHASGLPYEYCAGCEFTSLEIISTELRKQIWRLCFEHNSYETISINTPAKPVINTNGNWKRASRYLAKIAPAIQGAGGSNACYRAACKMRDLGLSADECLAILQEEYNPRCVPPWSDEELRHKVNSVYGLT